MMKENPAFLKAKYNLHASHEVEQIAKRTQAQIAKRTQAQIAKRTQAQTGEKVPQDPLVRIQNYLEYLRESLDTSNLKRENKLLHFKQVLYTNYVIKPDEIPDSYWKTQQRIAREQGHGHIDVTEELRAQQAEIIIADQRSSLDNWVDYLASPDATYPDWLKYWAMRSLLGMGEYDKEKKVFSKRRKDTVKPFPDLNSEALAYVLDAIQKKYTNQKVNLENTPEDEQKEFEQLLRGENFAKLYAWAMEKVTPASQEQLTNIEGKWVKYDQGSDHMPLVRSLQGHGTGWCTAGESTARAQLDGGDFYVYYSLNQKGKATIPRAAIRMDAGNIGEVRGGSRFTKS